MEYEKNFKTYDYLSFNVKKDMESVYIDTFENLGWKLINSEISMRTNGIGFSTKLNFKRDRKLNHKKEINEIQKDIETCFKNIETLNNKKYILPSIYAYLLGLIGTALVAISVFTITGYLSLPFAFSMILGFIGIALWIPPYFLYKNTLNEQEEKFSPKIENEYDKIDSFCEKAHNLILNNTSKE